MRDKYPWPDAAAIEHCSFDKLFHTKDGSPPDPNVQAAIDKYLAPFAVPAEEGKCLRCGSIQGGLMGAILGGFTYGIQHGEGWCSNCNWPARANHYIKDASGKTILTLRAILQYHPDVVVQKQEQSQ